MHDATSGRPLVSPMAISSRIPSCRRETIRRSLVEPLAPGNNSKKFEEKIVSKTEQAFDVPPFINSRPIGAVQYGIVVLCALVMFLDGLDTQAISYMAPMISKEWGLSREVLGPIFSSALTGLMFGYLVLSPLSDRFGHRRLILFSTVAFGLLTLVTLVATNVTELIVLRFLTGIALGAAIPSTVALTTEYMPRRLRATFVLAIYCGFSLGFVAAGGLAASMIPLYGWRSMLWIGAITPLTLAVLVYVFLPESLDFLVRTQAKPHGIWRIVRRLDRALPSEGPQQFVTEVEAKRSAVGSLFQSGRTLGTLVLWLVFGLNLAEFYALQSWLPTILAGHGFSPNAVALATSMTTIGGIVAAFAIGPAMDKLGAYRSLAVVYFAGVVFVALMGPAISAPPWVLMIAAFCAGFCIIGGPLLIGALLAYELSAASLFYAAAVPMLLAGILVALLGVRYRRPLGEYF